ncbi:DUF1350 family protein [Pseudanabaena yagii]|uniref:DUF1350 family protein n=1 Tax=Pseudanabaena yagii GIHE-NHR1 TaxID=2722753 RepID=A0ABX1LQM8_9CYAN|nr:DUF1350 family protein [Pseudanabaena yagii]NMF58427.1 DUF1350 family protein [Pseudanabaena yagii GIHE-NHR1]
MPETSQLNYRSLSHSQVILHPNPKGIIQFIGGFVFGSFPVPAYRYLHQFLFDQGYSLILYRFPLNPFQLNHWQVALDLLKEQYVLKVEIVKLLKQAKQPSEILNVYANPANYRWLGHSLGSKYVILLEILSHKPERRIQVLQDALRQEDVNSLVQSINVAEAKKREAEASLRQLLPDALSISQFFIRDQPAVLIAPEVSNTVRFLRSGWRISSSGTKPNQQQTENLIRDSKELFNLTGIISFNLDAIAEDDVAFLVEEIKHRAFQPPLSKELYGYHLQPLGIHIEDLGRDIVNFYEELEQRKAKSKPSLTSELIAV